MTRSSDWYSTSAPPDVWSWINLQLDLLAARHLLCTGWARPSAVAQTKHPAAKARRWTYLHMRAVVQAPGGSLPFTFSPTGADPEWVRRRVVPGLRRTCSCCLGWHDGLAANRISLRSCVPSCLGIGGSRRNGLGVRPGVTHAAAAWCSCSVQSPELGCSHVWCFASRTRASLDVWLRLLLLRVQLFGTKPGTRQCSIVRLRTS